MVDKAPEDDDRELSPPSKVPAKPKKQPVTVPENGER
jgi:hypothetical protein